MHKYNIPKEELERLREKGYTKAQLAKHFGCSMETISDRLLKYGMRRKYLKRKDEYKMIEMAKVYSVEDIAKICDADLRTVYYWLRELGITAQPRSKMNPDFEKKDFSVHAHAHVEIPKWKREIFEYYGVMPKNDEEPDAAKGVNCMKKCKSDCKYCSGADCVYLLIENHKRPCPPWNCTAYVQSSIKEKRHAQNGIRIKEV